MAPKKKRQKLEYVVNSVDDCITTSTEQQSSMVELPGLTKRIEDEDMLKIRRKTYIVHRADTSDLNMMEESVTNDYMDAHFQNNLEKTRRLTYNISTEPSVCKEDRSSLQHCSPGNEMKNFEKEITGMEDTFHITQQMSTQDSKPKKRGRKKKNTNMSAPPLNNDSKVIRDTEHIPINDRKPGRAPRMGSTSDEMSNKAMDGVKLKMPRKSKTADSGIAITGIISKNESVEDDTGNLAAAKTKSGRQKKLQTKEDHADQNMDDLAIDLQTTKPGKIGRKKAQSKSTN